MSGVLASFVATRFREVATILHAIHEMKLKTVSNLRIIKRMLFAEYHKVMFHECLFKV